MADSALLLLIIVTLSGVVYMARTKRLDDPPESQTVLERSRRLRNIVEAAARIRERGK